MMIGTLGGTSLTLTACSTYKPPVEQGNYLRKDLLSQIKIGSTRQQVIDTLGKPILDDVIDNDTWIYAYTKDDGRTLVRYKTIVRFKNNKVVNYLIVEE